MRSICNFWRGLLYVAISLLFLSNCIGVFHRKDVFVIVPQKGNKILNKSD